MQGTANCPSVEGETREIWRRETIRVRDVLWKKDSAGEASPQVNNDGAEHPALEAQVRGSATQDSPNRSRGVQPGIRSGAARISEVAFCLAAEGPVRHWLSGTLTQADGTRTGGVSTRVD